jgi:hypothetical protein
MRWKAQLHRNGRIFENNGKSLLFYFVVSTADVILTSFPFKFSLLDDAKAKDADPKDLATGIFKMLGADTNQKISKQQFIDG